MTTSRKSDINDDRGGTLIFSRYFSCCENLCSTSGITKVSSHKYATNDGVLRLGSGTASRGMVEMYVSHAVACTVFSSRFSPLLDILHQYCTTSPSV